MNKIEKLKELYNKGSKHSHYQILASTLIDVLGTKDIRVKSRFEAERLSYIASKIDFSNKTVLDIGGNTGYFTFEALKKGAKSVHYYEGNIEHAQFVKLAAEALEMEKQIEVNSKYYLFDQREKHYDVILLLNVLHHLGDDYGDSSIAISNAKERIIEQLNSMAAATELLVFQLGFCWKGNRNLLLFEDGTKQEMIEYLSKGISESWYVEAIGVAEAANDIVAYKEPSAENMQRYDGYGEFLNRPLFILKSKVFSEVRS